jgi:hypothetical protein
MMGERRHFICLFALSSRSHGKKGLIINSKEPIPLNMLSRMIRDETRREEIPTN